MKKGLFITFEGNEGCGKTTQIKLLFDFLKKKKRDVVLARDPGGTAIGDKIREVLLDAKNGKMSSRCETLLYMASRAQLTDEVLRPALNKGSVVLCDRWIDATLAYQGYARGVDKNWIRTLGKEATGGLEPSVTLFLDLPVSIGLARAKKRKAFDRMEKKGIAFHEKVKKGYLDIAKSEPRRFRRIAVSDKESIEDIHRKIVESLQNVL